MVMTWVTLGLGSNTNAYNNLKSCLDMLLLNFREMSISSVFESEAIGHDGNNYLNLVVGFETDMSVRALLDIMKGIENKHGRATAQSDSGDTPLDIDILTYGKQQGRIDGVTLPRAEVTENAFVLWPLSQVAGRHRHPALNKTYAELWRDFDKDKQKLWPVHFEWHGRLISQPGAAQARSQAR